MPIYKIDAKIEGKVATIYVRADSPESAHERLCEATFDIGRHMLVITAVSAIPAGADYLP
jgi:hypothetical protein